MLQEKIDIDEEEKAAAAAKDSVYGDKPKPKVVPEHPGMFKKMHAFVEQ